MDVWSFKSGTLCWVEVVGVKNEEVISMISVSQVGVESGTLRLTTTTRVVIIFHNISRSVRIVNSNTFINEANRSSIRDGPSLEEHHRKDLVCDGADILPFPYGQKSLVPLGLERALTSDLVATRKYLRKCSLPIPAISNIWIPVRIGCGSAGWVRRLCNGIGNNYAEGLE